VSVSPKAAEPPTKSAVSLPYHEVPKRRWTRLIFPFLLLAVGIAAWRSDPQTWKQFRLATLGGTASDEVQVEKHSPSSAKSVDDAFAGKGEIDVEGGLLRLSPLAYGEIEEVSVRVDQRVRVGDPLLRVRNKAGSLLIEEAKQGVAFAEIELDKAKRSPEDLQKQIQLVDLAIQAEERLVGVAQRNLDHLRTLSQQVSEESVRTASDAVAVAKQRLDAKRLERERLNLRRPQDDVRLAEAALEKARIKLAEATEDADRSILRARQPGKIVRVNANVGETFTPSAREPAVVLCPDKPWIVRCEIEQEFAGRVRVGMNVEVLDDATGERVGEGVVDRLSTVFAPRRQPVDDSRLHNDFRTMEVVVVLKTDHESLRIGQHVRAIFRPATRAVRSPGSA
jgi:multidrug resistance efflux pump